MKKKQKRRNYLKIGIFLFGIIFVTINCERDFVENYQLQENVQLNRKVLNVDIKEIPQIIEFIVEEKKNFLPKLEMKINHQKSNFENPFGTIDTSNIMALEDFEGNKAYTFNIDSFDNIEDVFYNLIILTDSDGTIMKDYIKKYQSINGEKVGANYTGKIERYFLDGSLIATSNVVLGSGQEDISDCVDCSEPPTESPEDGDQYNDTGNTYNDGSSQNSSGSSGSNGDDSANQGNDGYNGDGNTGADDSSNEGNDDGDDSSNGNTNTGGGGSDCPWHLEYIEVETHSGTTIIEVAVDCNGVIVGSQSDRSTPPDGLHATVVCCEDEVVVIDNTYNPCDQLNDLTDPNKANAKEKLQNLKTDSVTNSGESGFNFQKDSSGNYSNPDVTPGATNSVNLHRGDDNYGGAHSHPYSSTFPLFSWSDVFVLHELYKYANITVKQEVVMIVASSTTPNPAEVYAIKIDDYNAFNTQISKDFQNIVASDPTLDGAYLVKKIEALNKNLQTKYLSDLDGEKMFLEYFANHNISLYKADSDLDNWSELTLDDTFGTVIETPCN